MPIETIPNSDFIYYLIAFDKDGNERTDDPDGLMSERVLEVIRQKPVTDVFLFSHGWLSDIPASRRQYTKWIEAVIQQKDDQARFQQVQPGFYPLAIGLHWPSMPWGDYELGESPLSMNLNNSPQENLENQRLSVVDEMVDRYAENIADTPAARCALEVIFNAATENIAPETLPIDVLNAYRILDREAGLQAIGIAAAPSADRDPFDPEITFAAARTEALSFSGFSWGGLLAPLRTLSFWKMKDRAREFGENAAFHLLAQLQQGGGDRLRFHLMGHSFGCIVVSGALAGSGTDLRNHHPINSLLLVQGALSHWSYCPNIPLSPGVPGYFHGIITNSLVKGPIAITHSKWDTALGKWYPLGASAASLIRRSISFYSTDNLPKYGALGTFGASGDHEFRAVNCDMLPIDAHYPLVPGAIYNINADEFIREGSGPQGAHSDIARPEVAHLMWEAALTSVDGRI